MENQRRVSLICGQTGSGKSFHAIKTASVLPRVLILDAGFREYSCAYADDFGELVDALTLRDAFSEPEARFALGYTPYPDEYDLCFRLAWSLGNLTLVLEESDRFDELSPAYSQIIVRGRHHGVSILAVAPHPYNFPKDLRRQLTDVVSFRQTEESDLDYLMDVVGEDIYKVRDFEPGKYSKLVWHAPGPAKIIP